MNNSVNNQNNFKPLVTVIVPNYNHEKYLKQRLESIYNQTYSNFEVILMDDYSSDNSRQILEQYQQKYPEKTKLIFNEKNSGGVFFQWKKGLNAASGDLVWMAESDDFCSTNFLETLVPAFADESVLVSYCRSDLVNQDNKKIWDIEQYLQDIDKNFWKNNFKKTAHEIVNFAFGIKNIIPNASSAVFRKPQCLPILDNKQWQKMRLCGDWVLYLHLIRGGKISYSTEATNYYRIHQNNTSVNTYKKDIYYKEHQIVAQHTNQYYSVKPEIFHKQKQSISKHWRATRKHDPIKWLDKLYNIDHIKKFNQYRKPNILLVGYAFSAGGGETFPIQLANLFQKKDYTVTFLNLHQEPTEPGVKKMLYSNIPIIDKVANIKLLAKQYDIDIVHTHHAMTDHVVTVFNDHKKFKHVVSTHGMYEMYNKNKLRRELTLNIKINADKIVYTTDKNAKAFKEEKLFNNEKFTKIGNALADCEINCVNLQNFNIPSDAFTLCHVSRGIPEKGWQEAIESVTLARQISNKNIHLILIGEGPEYDRLKDCTLDYIHFLGFRHNIRDFYAACNLGFLPTRFPGESFPLVIIDCLLSGKPVLASNIGEISQMLKNDNKEAGATYTLGANLEIPTKNVADLIAKYATDNSFYQSHLQNVPSIAKKFSPEKLFENYSKVYHELFDTKKEIKKEKTLYLHIGIPKTGTSALQNFLHENRNLLLKHHNLHYVNSGMSKDFSHNKLGLAVHSITSDESLEEILKNIENEIKNKENVIISSECLYSTVLDAPNNFEAFNNFIKRNFTKTKIIVYLRRQDEWIDAMYKQNIMSGIKINFATQINTASNNFYKYLEAWSVYFGHNNIIVRPYEKNQLINQNSIYDFCSILGININEEYKLSKKTKHVSLDNIYIEFLKYINYLNLPHNERQRVNQILQTIQKQKKELNKQNFLNIEKKQQILQYHSKNNKNLAKIYLNRKDDKLFFSPLINNFSSTNELVNKFHVIWDTIKKYNPHLYQVITTHIGNILTNSDDKIAYKNAKFLNSSNKKKLYIHIGRGKTGTKSLQYFFQKNHKILEKFDISYPQTGLFGHGHHHLTVKISKYLDNTRNIPIDNWIKKFLALKTDNILISSELFFYHDEKNIEFLAKKLNEYFDVKIIIYLRPELKSLISGYQQKIKKGLFKKNIENFIQEQGKNFQYYETVNNWIKYFDKKNVSIFIFNKKVFFQNSLIKDFLYNVFNIKEFNSFNISQTHQNISWENYLIKFKLILNQLINNNELLTSFEEPLNEYAHKNSNKPYSKNLNYYTLNPNIANIIKNIKKQNEKHILPLLNNDAEKNKYIQTFNDDPLQIKKYILTETQIADILNFLKDNYNYLFEALKKDLLDFIAKNQNNHHDPLTKELIKIKIYLDKLI